MAKIKYYRNNPLLKGVGVQLEYTAQQIEEYLKCKNDPIYFIKTYVKIVDVDKGLVKFNLFDYQEKFIELLHTNNKVIGAWARQMGKCCSKTTKLLLKNNNYNKGVPFEVTIGELYEWLKFLSATDNLAIEKYINNDVINRNRVNDEKNN